MSESIWPSVKTQGTLDSASDEWLHTNGAGAYAMSTLALMHTRRYHGLLVAALKPPLDRYVIISHAETTLELGGRRYSLAAHQFPDIAPTPGYRLLEEFAQDPLPRWTYKINKQILERRLCLVRGHNTLVLSYTWRGRSPVCLKIKPLMPMRAIHGLRSEHGGLLQRVTMRRGQVAIQPVRELPEVLFWHQGVFMGSPDWWRRFEYPEDQQRRAHYQEDLWTPGNFELVLQPDQPQYVVAAVGDFPPQLDEAGPGGLMIEAARAIEASDPGPDFSETVRTLSVAAEQFRVPHTDRPAVLAGYPWLGVRTRDALISLPGLYLTPGLIEDAKNVLRTLIGRRRDGLLLSHFLEGPTPEEQLSVDASLWLGEAVRQLLLHVPPDDSFVNQELYPVLLEIFQRVLRVGTELVFLNSEGLLVARSENEPLTWMDSRARGEMVTPRQGLVVELQALWLRGCETVAKLAEVASDFEIMRQAQECCARGRAAFRRVFWCKELNYPYDCLNEHGQFDGVSEPAIRPNAVLALAIDPELFESWQANAIVDQAEERLLTDAGLRTLDPAHPDYIGYYEGGMEDRRAAYHQGVVWGYLLGALARAAIVVRPEDFELQMDLRECLKKAARNGPILGQVAQIASGDAPHHAGGCPAQAWSVAELLRALRDQLPE